MQHENSSFGWVEGACVVLGFFILWSVELPEWHTPTLSAGKEPCKNGWQVGTSIRNVGISIFDFGCPHYPLPLFHHLLFLEDNCNPPPLPSPPYSISSSLLSPLFLSSSPPHHQQQWLCVFATSFDCWMITFVPPVVFAFKGRHHWCVLPPSPSTPTPPHDPNHLLGWLLFAVGAGGSTVAVVFTFLSSYSYIEHQHPLPSMPCPYSFTPIICWLLLQLQARETHVTCRCRLPLTALSLSSLFSQSSR